MHEDMEVIIRPVVLPALACFRYEVLIGPCVTPKAAVISPWQLPTRQGNPHLDPQIIHDRFAGDGASSAQAAQHGESFARVELGHALFQCTLWVGGFPIGGWRVALVGAKAKMDLDAVS